jgi:hypothetical protein
MRAESTTNFPTKGIAVAEILLERSVPFQQRLHAILYPMGGLVAAQEPRTLLSAFQRHGGLMGTDEVVDALRRTSSQPLSRMARWIVSRGIVTLAWQGRTLVPLFQFARCDWIVRPGVVRVLDELRDTFDDGELALWFATPNVWLGSRSPLECAGENDDELWQAARADRFIARG